MTKHTKWETLKSMRSEIKAEKDAYSAGQKAFLIGVDLQNNPYRGKLRNKWAKGHLEMGAKYPPKQRLPYGSEIQEPAYKSRKFIR